MLRLLAYGFLFSLEAFATDLDTRFDPIPGVLVSENQVVVENGATNNIAQNYPIVQLFVAQNAGIVSSSVHDSGEDISLPDGVDFIVSSNASGTSYQVSVSDQKDWKTLIATSQKNESAEILSVGNFQVAARENEARFVRAFGNRVVYQNKSSEGE